MNNYSGISEIQSILEENGYPITMGNGYISTAGLWRDGDNKTAICIYPEKNLVIDFVMSEKYNIQTLVGKILGIQEPEKINEYLENKNYNPTIKNQELVEPIIKNEIKILDKSFINKLDKSDKAFDYWVNERKISLDVIKSTGGGVYKNKFYFPINNQQNQLIGWQFRSLEKDAPKRYSIRGEKKNFLYGNLDEIMKLKEVNLHEGIPDKLSMETIGINNNLVQFGTEISFSIINFLLRIPDIKIYLWQNNDEAGVESCEKNIRKLSKYFDYHQIIQCVIPDPYKDLNDVLKISAEKLKTIVDRQQHLG